MISEKQLDANRRNAQHSTGPKTEEGKRTSSHNACRHNLTGQVTAMTDEDRIAHDAFSAAMIAYLAPEGALEIQLAQRVATDSWRLNRIERHRRQPLRPRLLRPRRRIIAENTRKSTPPTPPRASSSPNRNTSNA